MSAEEFVKQEEESILDKDRFFILMENYARVAWNNGWKNGYHSGRTKTAQGSFDNFIDNGKRQTIPDTEESV
jgi:hypothetical protein